MHSSRGLMLLLDYFKRYRYLRYRYLRYRYKRYRYLRYRYLRYRYLSMITKAITTAKQAEAGKKCNKKET